MGVMVATDVTVAVDATDVIVMDVMVLADAMAGGAIRCRRVTAKGVRVAVTGARLTRRGTA